MKENQSALITVVIPVYNAENYLKPTIESILNQTYKNVEIIAVDDGSSDLSVDIIQSFAGRVALIQQQNVGPAAARNRGVAAAKGEWIAFLDADDLWESDKLEKQMQSIADCEWSYTDIRFMGGVNDGKRDSYFSEKLSGNIFINLISKNFISTSSVLIRRTVFNEVGGFDVALRTIEDWDFWIRIARHYSIAYVPLPLVRYRIHSVSSSRNSRKTLPCHLKVIEKIFLPGGVAEDMLHLKRSAKANSLSICSQIAEEEKDYLFAFQCAFYACIQQPQNKNCVSRMVKTASKVVLYWIHLYGR